jgi:hypothetical protein
MLAKNRYVVVKKINKRGLNMRKSPRKSNNNKKTGMFFYKNIADQ